MNQIVKLIFLPVRIVFKVMRLPLDILALFSGTLHKRLVRRVGYRSVRKIR